MTFLIPDVLNYICEGKARKKMLMIEAINNAFDNVQPKDNKALKQLEKEADL